MTADPRTKEETAGQSVRLVIGSVAVVLLLGSLGQTIVATALPTIVADLGGLDHLSWVITAYLLASTVVAPVAGKLGDLYGRKVVLQTAIVTFLIGAIVCGIAGDMTTLIAGRLVQGLGGGGLMVSSIAVVADVIPPRQRGRVQGIFGGVFGISTIIGPLLGGFLVEHLSWHWIFFVNLPIGLVAFLVIASVFRGSGRRVAHRIDYLGALLLTTALASTVLFTSLGGRTFAWNSAFVVSLMALAVASLIGFVLVERRAAEPVLPLSLFAVRTFSVVSAMGFIVGLAMFGSITFLPLFLQVVVGVSPSTSGLQLVPMVGGLLLTSIAAGQWMSRTGRYRMLPLIGTVVMVAGLVMLSTMDASTNIWLISAYMAVVGAGIGPVMTVSITATQNAVPQAQVGSATAGATLFRQVGGAIGVAAFGAIFSNRLAAELGAVVPSGALPQGAAGSFGPQMVQSLPPPLRELVLDAFTNALHPIFAVAAVAGVVAFGLGFMLDEIPLSDTLRAEEESGMAAEEEAAAAVVGGPVVLGDRESER